MTQSADDLAKKRYIALSMMRIIGIAMVMAGFLLIAGRWSITGPDLDRWIGGVLVLFGAFDFAVMPKLLARRWKSPGN